MFKESNPSRFFDISILLQRMQADFSGQEGILKGEPLTKKEGPFETRFIRSKKLKPSVDISATHRTPFEFCDTDGPKDKGAGFFYLEQGTVQPNTAKIAYEGLQIRLTRNLLYNNSNALTHRQEPFDVKFVVFDTHDATKINHQRRAIRSVLRPLIGRALAEYVPEFIGHAKVRDNPYGGMDPGFVLRPETYHTHELRWVDPDYVGTDKAPAHLLRGIVMPKLPKRPSS
jgi:hypothetical protein